MGKISCWIMLMKVIASLFCVALLLSTVMLDQGKNDSATSTTKLATTDSRENAAARISMDPLFSSSKRRVPNGPDPIHNRRAGKSGRPPGRV